MKTLSKPDVSDIIDLYASYYATGAIFNEDELLRIQEFYSETLPKLYRYRPAHDREVETVMNKKMWFSAMHTFNDPFEAQGIWSMTKLVAENALLTPDIIDRLERFKNGITVACLSGSNQSIVMWSHYAEEHKGVCLEYDTLELSTTSPLLPCMYNEVVPSLENIDSFAKYFLQVLSTKSKEWYYEEEWRLIRDNDSKLSNGALHDVAYPTAVYLGCNASAATIESYQTLCEHKLKIPLYKMEQSKHEYKLIPIQIV